MQLDIDKADNQSAWQVFLIFLKLGLTSFGGPVAHLGYFHNEFVTRRKWLAENSYADLVALCQFLPGPASSQVGISIGLIRAGFSGALAAWAGFTLPSTIALIIFSIGISNYGNIIPEGVLHSLKVAAVAVVVQAIWGMGRKLCTDAARVTIMALVACFVLLVPTALGQVGVIAIAAIIGMLLFKPDAAVDHEVLPISSNRHTGSFWLLLFFILLFGLPLLASLFPNHTLSMVDTFFRTGSLVFGGGHVVLPLLQAEVIPAGWLSNDTFLAGYGATQAVPGPLFTFSAFLGASMNQSPSGWIGGFICLLAIFAPSFLLVMGALPFWDGLRKNLRTRAALSGINAAVVGLLVAALYHPVWTSAIFAAKDFGLALLALVALMFWRLPAWLVVITCGLAGWLLGFL